MTIQQLTATLDKHESNISERRKYQDYYQGNQNILYRVPADPTKPNNRIVVNYVKKIVDFLTSYVVGVPVKYENIPTELQEIFDYNDEAATDIELVEQMNIVGYGAEIVYIDRDKRLRFKSVDPTGVIFIESTDLDAELLEAVRYFAIDDETYSVTVYSPTDITEYKCNTTFTDFTLVNKTYHTFGQVPVIKYVANTYSKGVVSDIVTLQDAINTVYSDNVNDFEAFVDAFLVLSGLNATTNEDIEEMKNNRVILLDNNSDAKWLVKDVNNEHIEDLKRNLVEAIQEVANVPNQNEVNSWGTSGTSANAFRYKLINTEIVASKQEREIKKGLQRRLEMCYSYLNLLSGVQNVYTDVGIVFTRNFIMMGEAENTQNNDKTEIKQPNA